MPKRTSTSGSELFIVDNSDTDWKVVRYLHDWCQISKAIDIATGYFEIGSLLCLKDEWQKVDRIRILMGDEVSHRTKHSFIQAVAQVTGHLNDSIEAEKLKNDFLAGVPAIVEALRSRKIECRVYRKDKFHAKAYITHARMDVIGASALVGSSNFTTPGLTENIELNVQITGAPVRVLQEWYEEHWEKAEDVTPEILRTIERHVRNYSPFDVYAKALYELFRGSTPGERKWEETQSRMYGVLDAYQRDGYHNLLKIAAVHGGGLLCDGVGLGKTFIGLMLIERLIVHEGRNVLLLAPKGALESVWKPALKKYLRRLSGGFSNLIMAAHTDLGLEKTRELLDDARERGHAILIDEAHHFRNPGAAGTGVGFLQAARKAQEAPTLFPGQARRSRYRELFDLIPSPDNTFKKVFLLTATPINNSFHDLRHMIELFTRKTENHFAKRLGIHSVTAHFKRMESRLDGGIENDAPLFTDSQEAQKILAADPLVSALVVQRSRAFVRDKQKRDGAAVTSFPPRQPPRKVDYSLQKVYGKLLKTLEKSFDRETPLFFLPRYYPLAYYTGPAKDIDPGDENRQKEVVALIRTSFLKRFESSVEAFRASCARLMARLLQWVTVQSETDEERASLADWCHTHVKLIEAVRLRNPELFGAPDDDEDDDLFEPELLEGVEKLPRDQYDVAKMLGETFADLAQLVDFFGELDKFDHRNDDKLKSLLKLLKEDPALSTGKLLIFTEFSDTADYLLQQLHAANIDAIERVDGRTSGKNRLAVIRRFSPYYNASSSADLVARGESEIRVLISTDVLSEGLNLQDAARLINYDLHWNPVRLMQRIGRVDRRRNPEIEQAIALHHPESAETRQSICFYNFLPPAELNELLTLYSKVTRKTLRISKALGIEGKKLLHADDDYQDLQHFNETYEGTETAMEKIETEFDRLLAANPALKDQLEAFPLRMYSGREHPHPPLPGTRAVFFCYRLPVFVNDDWTTDGGPCRWLLADATANGTILDDVPGIADFIRSTPDTPRIVNLPTATVAELRKRVESHLKNTYLKSLGIPLPANVSLLCWMELN